MKRKIPHVRILEFEKLINLKPQAWQDSCGEFNKKLSWSSESAESIRKHHQTFLQFFFFFLL